MSGFDLVLTPHSQRGVSSQSLCYADQMENVDLPGSGFERKAMDNRVDNVAAAAHDAGVMPSATDLLFGLL